MLVKELRGTESTQDACAKMRVKHNLKHSFLLLFKRFLVLFRESFSTRMWDKYKKGFTFNILSWVAQRAPPQI